MQEGSYHRHGWLRTLAFGVFHSRIAAARFVEFDFETGAVVSRIVAAAAVVVAAAASGSWECLGLHSAVSEV